MDSRYSQIANGVQAMQMIMLIMYAELIYEGNCQASLGALMLMFYFEKIAASILKQTARIVDTANHRLNQYDRFIKTVIKQTHLTNNPAEYLQIADIIENNPSPLTQQTNKFEQALRETCTEMAPRFHACKASLPPKFKKIGHAIYDQFTCTENSFVISTIAAGHLVPHQHFTSLSHEESENLVRALNAYPPYNFNITFGNNISSVLQARIRNMLYSNLKRAAWGCVAFQQGFRDQNSLVAMLPQEILNHIYAQVYPKHSSDQTQNRKNFTSKVSSYTPGLFKLHVTTHKPDELLPRLHLSQSSSII